MKTLAAHKSVMPKEIISGLSLKKRDVVIDATLGGGGHSLRILEKIGKTGKLIAIDQDADAIERFSKVIKDSGNVHLINENFENISAIAQDLRVSKVDAIIADLGLSSDQLDEAERGFTFKKDGPLDMRMDKNRELTAEKIINEYSLSNLINILKIYGDEKFARQIARKIIEKRKERPIKSTLELIEIIAQSVPQKYKHQRLHFATKTFQALRIEVNNEIEILKKFIEDSIELLKKGGRLAIITFHSGEDRIVKRMFRKKAAGCVCPPQFPVCVCGRRPSVVVITKKPIKPTEVEVEKNSRARSAKLRICQKI